MADEFRLRAHPEGTSLELRVRPKAPADRLLGCHDGALKLAVRAVPERGKANDAVCRFLAERLGLAHSRVTLLSGETSHDKTVLVRGVAPSELASLLASALSP